MEKKVQKLVKKEVVGYRYTTNDYQEFEWNKEHNILSISDPYGGGSEIEIQMTPENLLMLSELLRYVQAEKDEYES